jgi:Xaa-Pro aminopeptidase
VRRSSCMRARTGTATSTIGRTWPCSWGSSHPRISAHRTLYRRWRRVWDRVVDACRPGATGADLLEAYEASGEALPGFPIAYSVGLGYEGAVAGSALGRSFDSSRKLEPGMVLGIQVGIESDEGAYFALETVHITADGHEVLSKLSHGPLAEDAEQHVADSAMQSR